MTRWGAMIYKPNDVDGTDQHPTSTMSTEPGHSNENHLKADGTPDQRFKEVCLGNDSTDNRMEAASTVTKALALKRLATAPRAS